MARVPARQGSERGVGRLTPQYQRPRFPRLQSDNSGRDRQSPTNIAVPRGFIPGAAGIGQFAAIQATAPFGIELSAVGLHDAAAIEPAVAAFARDANGGLAMTAAPFGGNHPDVITTLAARYKLPAVYP
jgi:hypothetical protein